MKNKGNKYDNLNPSYSLQRTKSDFTLAKTIFLKCILKKQKPNWKNYIKNNFRNKMLKLAQSNYKMKIK